MPERLDHQLHFGYASVADGSPNDPVLVLYPHFQQNVIFGWLDEFSKHRQRATAKQSSEVVLSPNLAWVATLPNAKLLDHADFRFFGDDTAASGGADLTKRNFACRCIQRQRRGVPRIRRERRAPQASKPRVLGFTRWPPSDF